MKSVKDELFALDLIEEPLPEVSQRGRGQGAKAEGRSWGGSQTW